ncbi:hypothetical protein ABKN59_000933 [Abortiporus biennis]
MSSSTRWSHHHRRRSHSASPITGSHPLGADKCRTALKRARPSALRSPTYSDLTNGQPTQKWDVDMWRRGKRARKSTTPPRISTDGPSPFDTGSIFHATPFMFGGLPELPSTSAAFQFFPERPKVSNRVSRPAPRTYHPSPVIDIEISSVHNLENLRTSAFLDLQRSIMESGEGLVSRMRDWEQANTSSPLRPQQSRGRNRAHLPADFTSMSAGEESEDDEEDDIQIVYEDLSMDSSPHQSSPSVKKRALSMTAMDIDYPHTLPETFRTDSPEDDRCASPVPSDASDEHVNHGSLTTPPLTHTYTNSATSSIISLPLPSLTNNTSLPTSSSMPGSLDVAHASSTASHEEKALDALTLAMANGAGGLSDYEALRTLEENENHESTSDASLVGEMWH